MSDDGKITVEYQTVHGVPRKIEFTPKGGSTHWGMTRYERDGDEWVCLGGSEAKHPKVTSDPDAPALEEAFIAGFMTTGEGFNGEYAGSIRADPKGAAKEKYREWIAPEGVYE